MAPLTEYIAGMPGGKYIGNKWLKEPLVLCAVSVEEARYGLEVTAMAYPPHRSGAGDVYVFAIPTLVSRVLEWHAEEYVHSAVTETVGDWCDDIGHVAAGLAEQLEDIYELEAWRHGLEVLGPKARDAGLAWKDGFNVVARLYADDPAAHPPGELIEPAIAALRTQ